MNVEYWDEPKDWIAKALAGVFKLEHVPLDNVASLREYLMKESESRHNRAGFARDSWGARGAPIQEYLCNRKIQEVTIHSAKISKCGEMLKVATKKHTEFQGGETEKKMLEVEKTKLENELVALKSTLVALETELTDLRVKSDVERRDREKAMAEPDILKRQSEVLKTLAEVVGEAVAPPSLRGELPWLSPGGIAAYSRSRWALSGLFKSMSPRADPYLHAEQYFRIYHSGFGVDSVASDAWGGAPIHWLKKKAVAFLNAIDPSTPVVATTPLCKLVWVISEKTQQVDSHTKEMLEVFREFVIRATNQDDSADYSDRAVNEARGILYGFFDATGDQSGKIERDPNKDTLQHELLSFASKYFTAAKRDDEFNRMKM